MATDKSKKTELEFPACPDQLSALRSTVATVSLESGFSQEKTDNITLAVTEAFTNVLRHGYKECYDGKVIQVTLEQITNPDGLKIVMRDFGFQVEPCEICGRDLDDIRPGGLGVHIMRSLMDIIEFQKAPGTGMILTMTKYLNLSKD